MRSWALVIMIFAACLTSCQPTTIGDGPLVQKIDSEEASRLVLHFSSKMKKKTHSSSKILVLNMMTQLNDGI